MRLLLERQAENLLEKEGFNVNNREYIKSRKEIEKIKLKYPLAMKVISKKAIHKAKVGGVVLNIKNKKEAEKNFDKLREIKGFEGVNVQEMTKGKFMILGLKKTEEFGLVMMFGEGGIEVEEKRDISFRVCPVNEKDADEMIKEIKFYKKIKKKANLKLIKMNLLKLSKFAEKHPKINELDINPLIVNKDDAVIVDARAVIN